VRTQKQATGEDQLERLFVKESPKLWRALLAYSGDPETASDAVAEAFTLALVSSGRIASPAGWIWRVAFRVATAELKRRRRTSGDVPDRTQDWPAPAIEMLSALSRLSYRQRGSIVLARSSDHP
jgi:DNA-directed RNA polymerase specialized sigma24 family protein